MSLQCGAVLPCSVTEFTRIFGIPGKVAPFAIDIAMASCQPPVKVKSTYSLYIAVSCAMKEHSLLNIKCAFDFSELCFLPAEELPQVQILNPLNAFDWMVHGPFIQSRNLFKFVGVSSKLNDLVRLIRIDSLPVTRNRQGKIVTNKPETSCRMEGAFDRPLLPSCYIYLPHNWGENE